MKSIITIIAVTGAAASAQQIIYQEDFDGAGVLGYTLEDTSGNPIAAFNNGNGDYFAATDGSDIGQTFNNTGGMFFSGQDLDGTGNPNVLRLRIEGIDVSDFTDLELSIDFAEGDSSDGNEDWDDNSTSNDFVHANISLDTVNGGADNDPSLFGIWWEGGAIGDFNGAPTRDFDFDGTADSQVVLSDTFETFTQPYTLTGDTAGILITFALDAGDEDIAIDNITLSGTLVPAPAAAALFGLGGLAVTRRRR